MMGGGAFCISKIINFRRIISLKGLESVCVCMCGGSNNDWISKNKFSSYETKHLRWGEKWNRRLISQWWNNKNYARVKKVNPVKKFLKIPLKVKF